MTSDRGTPERPGPGRPAPRSGAFRVYVALKDGEHANGYPTRAGRERISEVLRGFAGDLLGSGQVGARAMDRNGGDIVEGWGFVGTQRIRDRSAEIIAGDGASYDDLTPEQRVQADEISKLVEIGT